MAATGGGALGGEVVGLPHVGGESQSLKTRHVYIATWTAQVKDLNFFEATGVTFN